MPRTRASAARRSWRSTASAAANTVTSPTRCRRWSRTCGPPSIRTWPRSPIGGTSGWRIDVRFPADHAAFIERCHQAGQTRPTPLLLQYGKDDYNCLHQDLYGEHVFPLQVAVLLSEPGAGFRGRRVCADRAAAAHAVPARCGAAAQGRRRALRGQQPPVRGSRGDYRVNLRHGVSRMRSGHRHTLGVIFPRCRVKPRPPPCSQDLGARICPWTRCRPAGRIRQSRIRRCWPAWPTSSHGAIPPHGHAGRLHHVGRHDQLRPGRMDHRPQRLPLRSRRSQTGRPWPAMPASFSELAARAARMRGIPGSARRLSHQPLCAGRPADTAPGPE